MHLLIAMMFEHGLIRRLLPAEILCFTYCFRHIFRMMFHRIVEVSKESERDPFIFFLPIDEGITLNIGTLMLAIFVH